jgi:hypothetical protein
MILLACLLAVCCIVFAEKLSVSDLTIWSPPFTKVLLLQNWNFHSVY